MSKFWPLALGLTAVFLGVQFGRVLAATFAPRLIGNTSTTTG